MLLSVVGSSAMTIAARYASLEIHSTLVVFWRSALTALAVLLVVIIASPLRRQLRFSRPWQHVIRGVLIGVSTQMGFYTIATIPLATTTVLFFTAPIFATLLSMILHGERVGPRRVLAIAAGFVGALIILRPGPTGVELGLLTGVASSVTFALALTMSRGLAQADGALSTYFSAVVFTVLVSVPIVGVDFALPQLPITWIALLALVITGTVRGVADIQAYRHAEAAILAPVTYLRLVLIGGAGYLVFEEVIDGPTTVGAVIIIGATLYIARREAQLRKS